MRYRIVLVVLILFLQYGYAQKIGIGIDIPTETLDVNGRIRLRDVKEKDNDIRPLFINQDGVIGKRDEAVLVTQVFSVLKGATYISGLFLNDYNAGRDMIVPLSEKYIVNNNLGVTQPTGTNNFKIIEEGFYEYSSFLHFYIGTPNSATPLTLDVMIQIEVSHDNGNTWEIITALRYLKPLVNYSSRNMVANLPNAITKHKQGDLIRMRILRIRNSSNNLLGAPTLTEFSLAGTGNIPYYALIINKL
ncbi:MAG: hypothetical protein LBE34_09195 [Flavobacteriaceae bacterium]|jgi:hypothetical protein|nr:hypothetical protein [Flavobacteriaceae bacterium]